MKKYFISQNGFTFGPYSFEDLRAMNMHPLTPVWFQGMGNWIPANQVGELQSLFYSNAQTYYQQPSPYDQPTSQPYNFSNANNPVTQPASSNKNLVIILVSAFLILTATAIFVVYSFKERREKQTHELDAMVDSINRAVEEQQIQTAYADSLAHYEDSVEAANKAEAAFNNPLGSSEFAGEYTNSGGGTMRVQGDSNYSLLIKITLKSQSGNNCSGEISGTGKLTATDEITMQGSSGCELVLSFSSTSVYVRESGDCNAYRSSNGNCSFEGFYFKK